jgi:hypothetical protein
MVRDTGRESKWGEPWHSAVISGQSFSLLQYTFRTIKSPFLTHSLSSEDLKAGHITWPHLAAAQENTHTHALWSQISPPPQEVCAQSGKWCVASWSHRLLHVPVATVRVIQSSILMKNTGFWDVTTFGSFKNQSSGGRHCHRYQGEKNQQTRNTLLITCSYLADSFHHDDGGDPFPRNVGSYKSQ